jgi:CheY-like chemotaxis protein
VGVAADGFEALAKCSQEMPDAVLCTLVVPVQDGIDFTRRMRELLGIGACG